MAEYILKLFITGHTPRNDQMIAAVQAVCNQHLNGKYQLTVVDLLDQPQLAEAEQILATPTLIREQPLPEKRLIGDLSDSRRIATALLETDNLAPTKTPE